MVVGGLVWPGARVVGMVLVVNLVVVGAAFVVGAAVVAATPQQ